MELSGAVPVKAQAELQTGIQPIVQNISLEASLKDKTGAVSESNEHEDTDAKFDVANAAQSNSPSDELLERTVEAKQETEAKADAEPESVFEGTNTQAEPSLSIEPAQDKSETTPLKASEPSAAVQASIEAKPASLSAELDAQSVAQIYDLESSPKDELGAISKSDASDESEKTEAKADVAEAAQSELPSDELLEKPVESKPKVEADVVSSKEAASVAETPSVLPVDFPKIKTEVTKSLYEGKESTGTEGLDKSQEHIAKQSNSKGANQSASLEGKLNQANEPKPAESIELSNEQHKLKPALNALLSQNGMGYHSYPMFGLRKQAHTANGIRSGANETKQTEFSDLAKKARDLLDYIHAKAPELQPEESSTPEESIPLTDTSSKEEAKVVDASSKAVLNTATPDSSDVGSYDPATLAAKAKHKQTQESSQKEPSADIASTSSDLPQTKADTVDESIPVSESKVQIESQEAALPVEVAGESAIESVGADADFELLSNQLPAEPVVESLPVSESQAQAEPQEIAKSSEPIVESLTVSESQIQVEPQEAAKPVESAVESSPVSAFNAQVESQETTKPAKVSDEDAVASAGTGAGAEVGVEVNHQSKHTVKPDEVPQVVPEDNELLADADEPDLEELLGLDAALNDAIEAAESSRDNPNSMASMIASLLSDDTESRADWLKPHKDLQNLALALADDEESHEEDVASLDPKESKVQETNLSRSKTDSSKAAKSDSSQVKDENTQPKSGDIKAQSKVSDTVAQSEPKLQSRVQKQSTDPSFRKAQGTVPSSKEETSKQSHPRSLENEPAAKSQAEAKHQAQTQGKALVPPSLDSDSSVVSAKDSGIKNPKQPATSRTKSKEQPSAASSKAQTKESVEIQSQPQTQPQAKSKVKGKSALEQSLPQEPALDSTSSAQPTRSTKLEAKHPQPQHESEAKQLQPSQPQQPDPVVARSEPSAQLKSEQPQSQAVKAQNKAAKTPAKPAKTKPLEQKVKPAQPVTKLPQAQALDSSSLDAQVKRAHKQPMQSKSSQQTEIKQAQAQKQPLSEGKSQEQVQTKQPAQVERSASRGKIVPHEKSAQELAQTVKPSKSASAQLNSAAKERALLAESESGSSVASDMRDKPQALDKQGSAPRVLLADQSEHVQTVDQNAKQNIDPSGELDVAQDPKAEGKKATSQAIASQLPATSTQEGNVSSDLSKSEAAGKSVGLVESVESDDASSSAFSSASHLSDDASALSDLAESKLVAKSTVSKMNSELSSESDTMLEDDPLADLKRAAARAKDEKSKRHGTSSQDNARDQASTARDEASKSAVLDPDDQLAALKKAVATVKAEVAAEAAAEAQSKLEGNPDDPLTALKQALSDPHGTSPESRKAVQAAAQAKLEELKVKDEQSQEDPVAALKNVLSDIKEDFDKSQESNDDPIAALKQVMQQSESLSSASSKESPLMSNAVPPRDALMVAPSGSQAAQFDPSTALQPGSTTGAAKINLHTTAAHNLSHTYGAYSKQFKRDQLAQSNQLNPALTSSQGSALEQSDASNVGLQEVPAYLNTISNDSMLEQSTLQSDSLAEAQDELTQSDAEYEQAKLNATKMQVLTKLMQNSRRDGLTDSMKQEIAAKVMSQAPQHVFEGFGPRTQSAASTSVSAANSMERGFGQGLAAHPQMRSGSTQGRAAVALGPRAAQGNGSTSPAFSVADMAAAIDENTRKRAAQKAEQARLAQNRTAPTPISELAAQSSLEAEPVVTQKLAFDELVDQRFRDTLSRIKRTYHFPEDVAQGFDQFKNKGNRYKIFHHANDNLAKHLNSVKFGSAPVAQQCSQFIVDSQGKIRQATAEDRKKERQAQTNAVWTSPKIRS